jgi:hypothetical protein
VSPTFTVPPRARFHSVSNGTTSIMGMGTCFITLPNASGGWRIAQ